MDFQKRKDRLVKILKQAVAINSQPTEESFPELPDVLIWIRFTLGLLYGCYLGGLLTSAAAPMKSGVYALQALNLITFFPVMYCRLYLCTPTDVFGTQIIFSGTFNALALALLIWIYCFTMANEHEEEKFSRFLLSSSSSNFVESIVETATTTAGSGGLAGDLQEAAAAAAAAGIVSEMGRMMAQADAATAEEKEAEAATFAADDIPPPPMEEEPEF